MEDRLMDLEIKVAFVEKHLAELDEIVRRMHDSLSRLQAEVASLAEERQEHGAVRSLADEKPPHY